MDKYYYKVGITKKEITPSTELIDNGSIYLWGWGSRNSPADGVLDKIWARALAIYDNDNYVFVLVSLDVCAIDPQDTDEIKARIEDSRGLNADQIAINVTHTHSAPVTVAVPTWNDGFDMPNPEYMEFLKSQVVMAIEEAIDNAEEATITFARGETDIGINRHFANPDAAYDRKVDVIRADNKTGKTIAIAFFHGCHPVTLAGSVISSDFPGVARDIVEKAFPEAISIFLQGYAGTINPRGDLEQTGEDLGGIVNNLLSNPMEDIAGPIKSLSSIINIPFQSLDPTRLTDAQNSTDLNLQRWANNINNLGDTAPDNLPTQLHAIHLGSSPNDCWIVMSSHEVVAEFSTPVRNIWRFDRVILTGYTNWQKSYLPNSLILNDPSCSFGQFPFCGNYEGGTSFCWYGHKAPIDPKSVDCLFIKGNFDLLASMECPQFTFEIKGNIYAIQIDGTLLWYRDKARDGTRQWADEHGREIGVGWADFKFVFSGGDGIVYAIQENGILLWYQDITQDGIRCWANEYGAEIGEGWADFKFVFSGGDGIIYAIQEDGTLLWYQDLARDGTRRWADEHGKEIGKGWADFKFVFSGGDGIIYAIQEDGTLLWYQDLARDGTRRWTDEHGKEIGEGWADFKFVFSGGDGVIYAIQEDGTLLWYQDLARDGTRRWAYEHGKEIGEGWVDYKFVICNI